MENPIIRVENLKKSFKVKKRNEGFAGALKDLFSNSHDIKLAVDNISFEVNQGEIVGYIGPNGAGKSTTIKMLVGILVPTQGNILVSGIEPYKNRIENSKKIGVVFGQRTQLWWDIPVSESFKLFKYMYKISDTQYKRNIEIFSDILGIQDFINTPVRQLSLGQRMRADFCTALLHNPQLLFLDEPTIGLDIIAKQNIREFVMAINKEYNTTVILTTHDMSDIEKLCSRVMVIDKGKIVYDGNIEELKKTNGSTEFLIVESDRNSFIIDDLKNTKIDDCYIDGNKMYIRYNKNKLNSTKVLSWIMERSTVLDFSIKETEIDEIIKKIYKGH